MIMIWIDCDDGPDQVFGLIRRLEELPMVSSDPAFRQSWLHVFLEVARDNFLMLNITTRRQFEAGLRGFLAQASAHPVSRDVLLAGDGVAASRFLLQTDRIVGAKEEVLAMQRIRQVVDAAPFSAYVFHPFFPFFDQFAEVLPQTIKTVLICILVMTIITLVFIPNRRSVIWVIFTIFSVEVGVVGFMSLWGVNLDVISMIQLIMGIGFSVDYSAHISYHYLSADPSLSPHNRLANSLCALGPPVFQGAVTTLLGVIPILFEQSYIVRTFAKLIFLVISLGLLHSLLLLPVLLTLLGPGSCSGPPNIKADCLSPGSLCLSDTFVYRRETPGSLRKAVLEDSVRRRAREVGLAPASPWTYCPALPSCPPAPRLPRRGIDNPTFEQQSPLQPAATFLTFRRSTIHPPAAADD